MTGLHSPTSLFSSHKFHQRNVSGTMSLGMPPAPAAAENKPSSSNGAPVASNPPAGQAEGSGGPDVSKQVQEVLASEIAIAAMLNRLKQSIAAAKEFALFLKKRSTLEEELAHGLKKLCRMSQENTRRPEHKQGTFAQAFDDMLTTHERMAENGLQFASSLHVMHDDLMELASIAERNRKGWKASGLSAEQRVSEIEAAMRKSKAKYDSLAEEYDRARMGDPSRQSGRAFFKGAKSAAEREEDLLKKVQAADTDYHGKVQIVQSERAELVNRTRPEAVKAITELVRETDSGVSLQMQKFASFNEKLLLSNGLCISPIKNGDGPQQNRSLREATASIDNEKDLNDYLVAHHPKVPQGHGEPKYERNPVLDPPSQAKKPGPAGGPTPPPGQFAVQPPPNQTGNGPKPGSSQGSNYNSPMVSPGTSGPPGSSMSGGQPPRPSSQQQQQQPPQHAQQHSRNMSSTSMLSHVANAQPQEQAQRHSVLSANSAALSGPSSTMSSQAPQLGALPFQGGDAQAAPAPGAQAHQRESGGINPLLQNPSNSEHSSGPPLMAPVPVSLAQQQTPAVHMTQTPPPPPPAEGKRVFGISLNRLYERDGLVVPMVVYQCVQAVDLFGLNLEGIYRQSGSMNSVNKLKTMFDADSSNPLLDFRNPENFFHDVNSVTGLLKQFFRDLPDPLFTSEHYKSFIEAAKHEDDTVRRDSLHLIINSLPDPNYATLRALTLHLHRVMENSPVNRMNSHNLAVIFGPTLMGGGDSGMGIEDAGWQIKVVDTVLQNTYSIFDDE